MSPRDNVKFAEKGWIKFRLRSYKI